MSISDLAAEVLDFLAGQNALNAARDTHSPEECQSLLIASKAREKRIKAACQGILAPVNDGLFTRSDR